MLHKKQYYGLTVNKNPGTLYKPPPAVKKVDTNKIEQNKNIDCEKFCKQSCGTIKCWSGIQKASKENSSNKTQVKFNQSHSKNKSQNNVQSFKQSSNKKGRSGIRNQGGRVSQVTEVNQLPPDYVPTPEEEDEDQGFQCGLAF